MSRVLDHVPGQTFHGRRGAVRNAFAYGVDYLLLDPDEGKCDHTNPDHTASDYTASDHAGRLPWLFSRDRGNLFSLHDRDHGGPPRAGRGTAWVREVLAAEGLDLPGGRILLLAQPRVLGHVFNPVSFWLCLGADASLRAVIAEVSNTFGDRHSYLCHHADLREILPQDTLRATKIFHVSPFQPVTGGYAFCFDIRPDRLAIVIDYTGGDGGLIATLTGPRRPLTDAAILRAALRRPFGSRRVLGLIHWQALKLWLKGARYTTRPEPPSEEVSK